MSEPYRLGSTLVEVSWSVDGTDVSATYPVKTLAESHGGMPSRLEWLLASLESDGCDHVEIRRAGVVAISKHSATQ